MDSARNYLRAQALLHKVLGTRAKELGKGQAVKMQPARVWVVCDPRDQEVLAIGALFSTKAQNIADTMTEVILRNDPRLEDARREALELLRGHREQ